MNIKPSTIKRRLNFCAGHRVLYHESKCANPHGHEYVAWIYARGPLDDLGRVIDFSVLKERVGLWLDEKWDHGFVVTIKDTALIRALRSVDAKIYMMKENPTAENMAMHLLDVCQMLFADDLIEVYRVDLDETANCSASAELQ